MGTLERKLPTLDEARLNWDIVKSGIFSAANSELVVDVEGAAWAQVALTDTFSLTFIVDATRDGTNYFQLPIYQAGQLGAPVAQVGGSVQGVWFVRCAGYMKLRIRCSAWVSGSAVVTIATCMAALSPVGVQMPEPLPLVVRPAVSAANTAMTVTLPAAGVGLFHIVHQIKIWGLNQSAAAIADSAGFDITTTNLSVTAWRNMNGFPAWTKRVLVDMDIENGLRSAAANTASTIVIPAMGAGVSAEALVLYKVGA